MRDLTVAVFRPDDDRLTDAIELIDSLGATPVADPMLAIEPTGEIPGTDADYAVFTSKTGVELVAEAGWDPDSSTTEASDTTTTTSPTASTSTGTTICAIGSSTADALRSAGYEVDIVPEEYTSSGLVETLADRVDGQQVEIARSDHGSDVLIDGLVSAGADVTETILYRLTRPETAGESVELAADGDLDVALFSSSLTVEHFMEIATARGIHEAVLDGLENAVVGVIGPPTRQTAEEHGLAVDVVPESADFDELACAAVERAAPTYFD